MLPTSRAASQQVRSFRDGSLACSCLSMRRGGPSIEDSDLAHPLHRVPAPALATTGVAQLASIAAVLAGVAPIVSLLALARCARAITMKPQTSCMTGGAAYMARTVEF